MARNRRALSNKTQKLIGGGLAVVTVAAVGGGLAYDSTRATAAGSGAPSQAYVAANVVPDNLQPIAVTRPADGPLKALFIGDSLNFGLYASTEAAGFRPRMMAAMEQSGPVELSYGRQVGGTAGEVAQITDLGVGNHVAIVELGTNDYNKTPLVEFQQQYARLLDTIRATSPDAALVCAGTWQPPKLAGDLNTIIAQQCANHGGKYRTLGDLYMNETNRGPAGVETYGGISDDFHPNDKGYESISERLLGALSLPA